MRKSRKIFELLLVKDLGAREASRSCGARRQPFLPMDGLSSLRGSPRGAGPAVAIARTLPRYADLRLL
jgi:hypothetical protein